jgi:hypothetical protein
MLVGIDRLKISGWQVLEDWYVSQTLSYYGCFAHSDLDATQSSQNFLMNFLHSETIMDGHFFLVKSPLEWPRALL